MVMLGERRSRILIGVVLADQRGRVGAHGPGDAADVPARVEVAAACGEVTLLDVPDD
jgi:ribosomal protein S5